MNKFLLVLLLVIGNTAFANITGTWGGSVLNVWKYSHSENNTDLNLKSYLDQHCSIAITKTSTHLYFNDMVGNCIQVNSFYEIVGTELYTEGRKMGTISDTSIILQSEGLKDEVSPDSYVNTSQFFLLPDGRLKYFSFYTNFISESVQFNSFEGILTKISE